LIRETSQRGLIDDIENGAGPYGPRPPEDQERKLPFIRELKTFMEGVKLDGAALAPVDLDGLMNSLDRIKSKMLTADGVSLTLLPALLTVAAGRRGTTEEKRNVVSEGEI